MKRVKRVTLGYTQGKSDKVYEVDLCEVGGQFIVNFRYGRRGGKLKEGSKTPKPVARDKAETIFNKLVSDKSKKGYVEESAGTASPPVSKGVSKGAAPKAPSKSTDSADFRSKFCPRAAAVCHQLSSRARGSLAKSKGGWGLDRVAWRAGEMALTESEDDLLAIVANPKADFMHEYSALWALAHCGTLKSLTALRALRSDQSWHKPTHRMATEALRLISLRLKETGVHKEVVEDALGQLPSELQSLARSGPTAKLIKAVEKYTGQSRGKRKRRKAQGNMTDIDLLYVIDNEHTRPAVLAFIDNAAMAAPQFQSLRHLFKMSELRGDGEVYGRLLRRIERSRPMYRQGWYMYIHTANGNKSFNWKSIAKEKAAEKPSIAFNQFTRGYFLKRTCRVLKRLGELKSERFVQLATGILKNYRDEDAVAVKTTHRYDWRENRSHTLQYDRFAPYLALNYLLYARSSRYYLPKNHRAYLCRSSYSPGQAAPDQREEAHPEIWDKHPEALLEIISESRCQAVQDFACKALKANTAFLKTLTLDRALGLLDSPYEVAQGLALELMRALYDPQKPHKEMLLKLAHNPQASLREQGLEWLRQVHGFVLADTDMLSSLILGAYSETRQFGAQLLQSGALSGSARKTLLGRLVSQVLALDFESSETKGTVKDLALLLTTSFVADIEGLSEAVLRDLLEHSQACIQELSADLLTAAVKRLPSAALIDAMIRSDSEKVRTTGTALLMRFDDKSLLGRQPFLLNLALHARGDVRRAAVPLIERLAAQDSKFFAKLLETLIEVLIANKAVDAIAELAVQYLSGPLEPGLKTLKPDTVWRLLRSKSQISQSFGGQLLKSHVAAKDLSIEQISGLAQHEILTVRQAAWAFLESSVGRVRKHMDEAILLFRSEWTDTREFGFRYFGESFTAKDWPPALLVTLCDSVRPDVQRFAQDLITQYFKKKNGPEYLVKLSEHPSANVQLFVTPLLEQYADGKEDLLEQLLPYFTRVLSLVNRGRTAKQRVLEFLRQQACDSESAARLLAPLLDRQSVTMAVESKAALIDIMTAIKQEFPTTSLPLQIKSPERRPSKREA